MLEPTKKRRTENIRVTFEGPADAVAKLVECMKTSGDFVEVSGSVPWREAFTGYSDEELPGVALAGARAKEGLTQKQLSKLTGIPQRHISEMENGKRAIGKARARKLAEALKVSYRIFL